eukprot:1088056_1
MEFKRMMKQFETKKEDLIRITKQLRKIRKESKGLRHDTQAMAQHTKQKEGDGLLNDFGMDSKGKDIQIFGEDLTQQMETTNQKMTSSVSTNNYYLNHVIY